MTRAPNSGTTQTRPMPKVAIVDFDHRVQVALAQALGAAGLDIVGTAGEVGTALGLVEGGTDVVVVDPRLPDLTDGRVLIDRVARDWPSVRIVLMGWSDYGDSELGDLACAFVSKSAPPEDFFAATLTACGPEHYRLHN
jgi:DNA-binding NtrC family response regulator